MKYINVFGLNYMNLKKIIKKISCRCRYRRRHFIYFADAAGKKLQFSTMIINIKTFLILDNLLFSIMLKVTIIFHIYYNIITI